MHTILSYKDSRGEQPVKEYISQLSAKNKKWR